MVRPLRIEFPGALYHVTSRGNRQEQIYTCDGDHYLWLRLFAQTCMEFKWTCYAWCHMTNHFHIVIETADPNLSKGMAWLNGNFTRRFNRAHDRIGHVFQGRYHSVLVQRQTYLLELARYVVLNPVRAGLVRHAAEWRWSSYGATAGLRPHPEWLKRDAILRLFDQHEAAAIGRYKKFVDAGVRIPSIWEAKTGNFLGGDSFINEIRTLAPDQAKVSGTVSDTVPDT